MRYDIMKHCGGVWMILLVINTMTSNGTFNEQIGY